MAFLAKKHSANPRERRDTGLPPRAPRHWVQSEFLHMMLIETMTCAPSRLSLLCAGLVLPRNGNGPVITKVLQKKQKCGETRRPAGVLLQLCFPADPSCVALVLLGTCCLNSRCVNEMAGEHSGASGISVLQLFIASDGRSRTAQPF